MLPTDWLIFPARPSDTAEFETSGLVYKLLYVIS